MMHILEIPVPATPGKHWAAVVDVSDKGERPTYNWAEQVQTPGRGRKVFRLAVNTNEIIGFGTNNKGTKKTAYGIVSKEGKVVCITDSLVNAINSQRTRMFAEGEKIS